MAKIRKPNVAGQFYPDDHKVLLNMINELLLNATNLNLPQPKAMIIPHAGYIFSGPVAATAYALLQKYKNNIKRVILLGPSHRTYFKGIATTAAEYLETPLGTIELILNQEPKYEAAFDLEHCLEVHIPFLQVILPEFKLLPFTVGDADPISVANTIAKFWGDNNTLIIISSDLSHFHNYQQAQQIDAATTDAILNFQLDKIDSEQACGCIPIKGLLHFAKQKNMQIKLLDLRNSGDTSGTKDRVVGYGAYGLWES